jgi:hypothetical protein
MTNAPPNGPGRGPILSTPCSWPGCSLWFAKALLFRDHVRLEGWSWTGRQARRIPLDEVERVRWWGVSDGVNFMLCLEGGERLPLRLDRGAGTWNCKIHDLLDQSLLDGPGVPDAAPDDAGGAAAENGGAGDKPALGEAGGDGAVGHSPPPRNAPSNAGPAPDAAAPDAAAPDAAGANVSRPDAAGASAAGADEAGRTPESDAPPADAPS